MEAPFETRRLTLRPPQSDDADWIARDIAHPGVLRMLTTPPSPYRFEDAVAWLEKTAGKPGNLVIVPHGRAPVGVVTLPQSRDSGELGYWLAEHAWGHGYMSEAVTVAAATWFHTTTDPLRSGYITDNPGSCAVLTKAGFRATHIDRAHANARGGEVEIQRMVLDHATWTARRTLPTLMTPRLSLRPHRPEDAPDFARIGGDPRVAPMLFRMTAPWPVADAAQMIAETAWQDRLGFRLAVCRRSVPLIGSVSVFENGAIAYCLDPDTWGQGLIQEALRAFLPALVRRFDLAAVTAEVFQDNPRSAQVLQRLGFLRIGAGLAASAARLEPAPVWHYRLERSVAEALL